jgi:hypothetical protein
MTIPQLKEVCASKGLTKSGNKHDIIQRIVTYEKKISEPKVSSSTEVVTSSVEKVQIQPKHLEINNIIVDVRYEDGYVNATQLGKAMGKEFNDWYRLKSTKELIEALSYETRISVLATNSETGIPVSATNPETGISTTKFVKIIKGGNDKLKQGSWIHPDLVIQYAQWGSPKYAITVSRYMRELHLTGSINISEGPKSNEQLFQLQQELANTKSLLSNSEKLLLTQTSKIEKLSTQLIVQKRHHSYYKFEKGPSFYIISDMENEKCSCPNKVSRYKVGIEDVDVNNRLQTHRTTLPSLRLDYLIYTVKNRLIESCILQRFSTDRLPYLNHEWIFGVDKEKIIDSVEKIMKYLKIDYIVEKDIEKYNKTIQAISNFEEDDINDEEIDIEDDDLNSDSDNDNTDGDNEEISVQQPPNSVASIKIEEVIDEESDETDDSDVEVEEKSEVARKVCITCKESKELSHAFFRNITSYGSYRDQCIVCELKAIPSHIKPNKPIEIPVSSESSGKICSGCKKVLSFDMFSKNKTRADGYEYTCKNCDNARKGSAKQFVLKPKDIASDKAFCSKCEIVKPRIDFRPDKNRKNGLQCYCNLCANTINSINKKKNKIAKTLKHI